MPVSRHVDPVPQHQQLHNVTGPSRSRQEYIMLLLASCPIGIVVFECAAMCVHFELIEDSREVFIHVRLVKFDMVLTEATQYRLEKKAVNVIGILHQ